MARKPRSKPVEQQSNKLLSALQFCQLVLSDKGTPVETHLTLNNRTATAFNGILSAGHLIDEDLNTAPNNKLMIEALSKCGQNLSITQADNKLSIRSDKFKAIVPCLDPSSLPVSVPDNNMFSINDDLIKAIEAVGVLANEDAQTVHAASILIRSGSAVSTNGFIIFEYWHGMNLPTLALPKAFVSPIVKATKKINGFGFSENSVTFWFEDNCWLKSQLYRDQWPDVDHLLNRQSNMFPVPAGFWEALDAIAPFAQEGFVYFDNELIKTHRDGEMGATYEVAGIPKGPVFNIKNLMMIKPFAQVIDFVAPGPTEGTTMLMFQGDRIRGVMLGRI